MIKLNAAAAIILWGTALCGAFAASPAAAALKSDTEISAYRDYVLGRYAWANDQLGEAARYFSRALQHHQTDPVLLQRTFELALAAGNVRLAGETAQALYKADPQNSSAALVLIAEDFRKGRFEQADKKIEGLAVGGIEAVIAPVLKAWSAVGRGDKAAALQLSTPTSESGVLRQYQLEHAAHIRLVLEDAAGANSYYQELLKTDDRNWRLQIAAAAAVQRMGNRDGAIALLKADDPDRAAYLRKVRERLEAGKSIEIPVANPAEGLAELMFRAAAELAQGQPTPLSLIFARVATIARPDFSEAQLLAAKVLSQGKGYQGALATLQAIDTAGPVGVDALVERSRILAESGRTDEALVVAQEAVAMFPNSVRAQVELGEAFRRKERYQDAIAAYSDAINRLGQGVSGDNWFLFYLRGVAYERAGNWAKAEPDLRRALELRPNEPNVMNYLGYALLEQRRNMDEARKLIERAVEQRPGDGFIIDSLGWAYFMSGKYDAAVQQLELAVAAEPGDPTINEHLGDAYWRLGRTIEARFRWQAALDCEPDAAQSRRLSAKLEAGLDAGMALAADNSSQR